MSGTIGNIWGMDQIWINPQSLMASGLVLELSKVRSVLETRKYIIIAGLVSFIDKSDHRFSSCGAGPVPERGRSVSRFGP